MVVYKGNYRNIIHNQFLVSGSAIFANQTKRLHKALDLQIWWSAKQTLYRTKSELSGRCLGSQSLNHHDVQCLVIIIGMTTRAYEWNALKCGTAAVARPSSCPSPLLSLNDRWRRQFGLDLAWSLGQTGIDQTSWMKVWSCKSPRDNVNFFICQEMLRFVAVLSCSLLVPSMANKCFVVAWCGLALLACGGAVCNSVLSCFVLAALGIELVGLLLNCVEPEHMRQQISRPAHTVYIYSTLVHITRVTFMFWDGFNI